MVPNISSPDFIDTAYLIVKDEEVVDIGYRFTELTGYSKDEVFQKHLSEVLNNMLRINCSVQDIEINKNDITHYLFTKSYQVIDVDISLFEGKEIDKKIYTFVERANSRLDDKLIFVSQTFLENTSGAAIFSAPDLILLKANQRFLDACDSPFNKIENSIGRHISKFVKGFIGSHAEVLWNTVLETQKTNHMKELLFEGYIRGATYWDATQTPIFEKGKMKYILEITTDVTEGVLARKRYDEQAKLLEQKTVLLTTIANHVSDMIIVVDKDGNYLYENEIITNYNSTAINKKVGGTYFPLKYFDVDGNELPFEKIPILRIMNGEKINQETLVLKSDKGTFYLRNNGIPVYDDDGNFLMGICCTWDVTEQVEQSNLIKKQNARLNMLATLINLSNEAIFVWDLNGTITYWNLGAEKMYGYSAEEAIGRASHDLLKTVHPSKIVDIKSILIKNGAWNGEIEHTTKDSRKLIIETSHQVILNELGQRVILETNRDITERKLAEQEKFNMLNSITDVFFTFNREWQITYWNNAAEEMFNIKREEILGKVFWDVFPKSIGSDFHKHYCYAMNETQPVAFETQGAYTDYWVEARAYPSPEGLTVYLHNITERKKTEEALLESEVRFRTMQEEAEKEKRLNEAKSQFLANMSHEIRTPMNGILGMAQLLEMDLDDEHKNMAIMIKKCGENLLTIINDILDLSKIESGKVTLSQEKFDINILVSEVNNLIKPLIISRGFEYISHNDKKVTGLLIGDSGRLKQILINLLGNAIKFTDSGSIELTVVKGKVYQDRVQLVFSVKDTGIGIADDKIGQLFTYFTQGDNSVTKKYGGTGLGLAISKQLINMMDGEISVESKPGVGSNFTFNVIFSLATDTGELNEGNKRETLSMTLPASSAFLVEDDYVSGVLMKKLCERRNINLKIATSGKEALEILEHETFDFIFMDIQMPDISGYETTNIIRSREKLLYKHTPIVATTAFALESDKQKCIDAGMDDYLCKPIDVEKFNQIVEKYVHGK